MTLPKVIARAAGSAHEKLVAQAPRLVAGLSALVLLVALGPPAASALADSLSLPSALTTEALPVAGIQSEDPEEGLTPSEEAEEEAEVTELRAEETEVEAEPELPAAEPQVTAAEPMTGALAQKHKQKGASVIIGIAQGAGWGVGYAKAIHGAGITWNRVEVGQPGNTVAESLADGFKVLAIVGNVEDGAALSHFNAASWGSQVASQIKSNPGISIAEAGNEMYLKGGVANPVQYGHMYLAAVEDLQKAGIKTPLLFNMTGDYQKQNGEWSQDAKGGGWLRDAVNGVPGLAAAIRSNGISIHPYGELDENTHDRAGVQAAAAEEAVAATVLGSTPPFYITEFGYTLSNCHGFAGACSDREQAAKLKSAFKAFIADPNIKGIFWYQTRDDSTGNFGVFNENGSKRTSFNALSKIARKQGG